MGDLRTVQADEALRDFIRGWSDVYEFTYEQGMWHARRRDSGAVVHVATPEDLAVRVMEDFTAKPVRVRTGRP